MRENLPYLNEERLNIIFKHVYDSLQRCETENAFDTEKLSHLLKVLKTMQEFNLQHRPDDTHAMFEVMDSTFHFVMNSEGTGYWLSLILAVKELYGFSSEKLISVMEQISIRK